MKTTDAEEINGIINFCVEHYRLKINGTHGLPHWARVMNTGREICARIGVPHNVVDLFAVLHDSQRFSEGRDPEHGPRAAEIVVRLRSDGRLSISQESCEILELACRLHSTGARDGPMIAQICWDADRLDLGRVGISPKASMLCTMVAKEPDLFSWAVERGRTKILETLPLLRQNNDVALD